MRVVDRLAQREQSWRELETLLDRQDGRLRGRLTSAEVLRLGELYRAACADLMLAEAHDLPRETVAYLHSLVGRAHNSVYRGRGFRAADFARAVFGEAPRQIRADPAVRISAAVFYGVFLVFALLAAGRPGFAARIVGEPALETYEEMYSTPPWEKADDLGKVGRHGSASTGFYIQHNAGIGLQCFAWGLAVGLGSLFLLISNALQIGVVFGHMATTSQAPTFFTFVTAHGPFELTAIVFSAAAGMRLGYGLIATHGMSRLDSLRHSAGRSLPIVGAAVVLFCLAAFIEGFVSPSPLPYAAKVGVAAFSATVLVAYVALGGRDRRGGIEVPRAA